VLLVTHARPGTRAVVPALIGAFAVGMLGITGLVGYRLRPELLYGWQSRRAWPCTPAWRFVLLGIGYAAAAYRVQHLGELFRQREDLRVGCWAAR